ncbi:MAG: hypothetical protein CR993_06325 [Rhodobacterales bacterium]|nr:MAG: hypothetical protein CR993_06325 [Rhodobacterales bacterium]
MNTTTPQPLVETALYVDTPIYTALRQIAPYFEYGIFDARNMPVFIKKRPVVTAQRVFTSLPKEINIRSLSSSRVPLKAGGVVYYPFNSQSNMNAVTHRQYRHVLTLHGESHKMASARPAARMYDYVCVAGPAAIDRYLDHKIFTAQEADQGRLIQVGDSFVQRYPWLKPETGPDAEDGVLFWCPTWEGYDGKRNNYSSVSKGIGFDVAARAARAIGTERIVVKPHPYMGMLRPLMWRYFISGIRRLETEGFDVSLVLNDTPTPLQYMLRVALPRTRRRDKDVNNPIPVRLGLTDISGMEAALLVAHIPTMTIALTPQNLPEYLRDIYDKKTLVADDDIEERVRSYRDAAVALDTRHRSCMFGYQDPSLQQMSGPERFRWLTEYAHSDPFWQGAARRDGH